MQQHQRSFSCSHSLLLHADVSSGSVMERTANRQKVEVAMLFQKILDIDHTSEAELLWWTYSSADAGVAMLLGGFSVSDIRVCVCVCVWHSLTYIYVYIFCILGSANISCLGRWDQRLYIRNGCTFSLSSCSQRHDNRLSNAQCHSIIFL